MTSTFSTSTALATIAFLLAEPVLGYFRSEYYTPHKDS
jgi:hypothetical protein